MKKFLTTLFILEVLCLQCTLGSLANDENYQINANCTDGNVVCPGELQPACPGKKKPECIKLNNVFFPSCYLTGNEEEVISFEIDTVKCVYGDHRLSR